MKRTVRKLSLLLSLALALSLAAPAALALEIKGTYTEGMATATDGSAWGYVNASGIVSIPLRFEEASDFSLGVARVKEDGKYGLLRQDGLWLMEPLYDSLTPGGRACGSCCPWCLYPKRRVPPTSCIPAPAPSPWSRGQRARRS